MSKRFNFSSPIGIALTVGGLLLALSPQARRALRQFMVKGTATALDTMEQVGGLTAGLMGRTAGTGRDDRPDTEREVDAFSHPVASHETAPTQTQENKE